MRILTNENTKTNLEDRITYILSEWLNDNAPLGQERYRLPAKAVIKEILQNDEPKLEDGDGNISFHVPSLKKPVVEFRANGDIYVKGRKTKKDTEVVEGFKRWLSTAQAEP